MIIPANIDHLVFRIRSFDQTDSFYTALLGPAAYRDKHSLMYLVGATRIFFTLADESLIETYNKEKVGLNHFAFSVCSLGELEAIQAQLEGSGIQNSGIKVDKYGSREFIWLDDPDGLRLEFYLRSE